MTFLFTFASMIVHHPVLDNILSGAFVMMEGGVMSKNSVDNRRMVFIDGENFRQRVAELLHDQGGYRRQEYLLFIGCTWSNRGHFRN